MYLIVIEEVYRLILTIEEEVKAFKNQSGPALKINTVKSKSKDAGI